jgi:hypothetical protein
MNKSFYNFKKCAVAFLFLFFLHGTSIGNGQQGISYNGWRLAEVPHSRNFGFEQELSCGILANRCYAYVPTCLAGISFGTRIEIFN